MGKKSKKGQTHHAPHAHHKAGEGTHGHHQLHNGAWYQNNHHNNTKPQDDDDDDSRDFVVHDNSTGVFMLGDFDETHEELIESPHQSFDHSNADGNFGVQEEKKEPESPTTEEISNDDPQATFGTLDAALPETNDDTKVDQEEDIHTDTVAMEAPSSDVAPEPAKDDDMIDEPVLVVEEQTESVEAQTANKGPESDSNQTADSMTIADTIDISAEVKDSDEALVESTPVAAEDTADEIQESTMETPTDPTQESEYAAHESEEREQVVQEATENTELEKPSTESVVDDTNGAEGQKMAVPSAVLANSTENTLDESEILKSGGDDSVAVEDPTTPSRPGATISLEEDPILPIGTPQAAAINEETPFDAEASPVPHTEQFTFETPQNEDDHLLEELLEDTTPPIVAKPAALSISYDPPSQKHTAPKPSSKMTQPKSSRVPGLSHHQHHTPPKKTARSITKQSTANQSVERSPKPASTRPRTTKCKPFNLSSSNHSKNSRKSASTAPSRSPHKPDHLGAFYGRHTKHRADVWEVRSPTATPDKNEPQFVFHARPVPKSTYTPPRQKLYQQNGLSRSPAPKNNYQFKARPLPKSYRRGDDGESIASSRK